MVATLQLRFWSVALVALENVETHFPCAQCRSLTGRCVEHLLERVPLPARKIIYPTVIVLSWD